MIPTNEIYDDEDEFEADFTVEEKPSLTYAMKIKGDPAKDNTFLGTIDEEEAIRQAIMKILNTERYEHEIYSWDYGIELQDLFGQPMNAAMSELEHRITDALTADDRIEEVKNFTGQRVGKRTVHCMFTVVTAQGDEIEEETEVEV